ncbi:hypothetical protein ACQ4PT_055975 [Festuca glaucescens]
MTVTLNAYNVLAARCAAEFLEMFETIDKGNLIYKIDVFLSSSIFRTWKDSIIVLQTTKSLLPWSENLKVINHCVDSIAARLPSTRRRSTGHTPTTGRNSHPMAALTRTGTA